MQEDTKLREAFKKILVLTGLAGFVVLLITYTIIQLDINGKVQEKNLPVFPKASANDEPWTDEYVAVENGLVSAPTPLTIIDTNARVELPSSLTTPVMLNLSIDYAPPLNVVYAEV
jgi:hypothetical protein